MRNSVWIIQDQNGKVHGAFDLCTHAFDTLNNTHARTGGVTIVDEKPGKWFIFKSDGGVFYTVHLIELFNQPTYL